MSLASAGPLAATFLIRGDFDWQALAEFLALLAHLTAAAWLLASTRFRIDVQIVALLVLSLIVPAIAFDAVRPWSAASSIFELQCTEGNTDTGATWLWRIGPILALLLGGALLARRPGSDA